MGAHGRAGEHRTLDAQRVEDRKRVGGEVGVLVGVRGVRRRGLAVAARVGEHHPVAAALERLRPHNDVAARRRQPVHEQQRGARGGWAVVLDGDLTSVGVNCP
jgi:hypothetical protein